MTTKHRSRAEEAKLRERNNEEDEEREEEKQKEEKDEKRDTLALRTSSFCAAVAARKI